MSSVIRVLSVCLLTGWSQLILATPITSSKVQDALLKHSLAWVDLANYRASSTSLFDRITAELGQQEVTFALVVSGLMIVDRQWYGSPPDNDQLDKLVNQLGLDRKDNSFVEFQEAVRIETFLLDIDPQRLLGAGSYRLNAEQRRDLERVFTIFRRTLDDQRTSWQEVVDYLEKGESPITVLGEIFRDNDELQRRLRLEPSKYWHDWLQYLRGKYLPFIADTFNDALDRLQHLVDSFDEQELLQEKMAKLSRLAKVESALLEIETKQHELMSKKKLLAIIDDLDEVTDDNVFFVGKVIARLEEVNGVYLTTRQRAHLEMARAIREEALAGVEDVTVTLEALYLDSRQWVETLKRLLDDTGDVTIAELRAEVGDQLVEQFKGFAADNREISEEQIETLVTGVTKIKEQITNKLQGTALTNEEIISIVDKRLGSLSKILDYPLNRP